MSEITITCEKCGREMYTSVMSEEDTVAWKDVCKYCRQDDKDEDKIVYDRE